MRGALVAAGRALSGIGFLIAHWNLMRGNRRFFDAHRGERCFILCNGPSVLGQDLLPLRNEVVMSVSSGYLYRDFDRIRPRYHFVPPMTFGMITEQDAVRWFQEMHDRLGEAELFLGSSEHGLVARHALFSGRRVSYLCCALPFLPREDGIISLCGPVPSPASVPIMCLVAALYMGFRDIYLLGTEHDSFATRKYKYAFEPTVMRGKDFSVDEHGDLRIPLYEELASNLALWTQYRHVKRIALHNGRNVWNATVGGLLDEFPRVALEEALAAPRLRGLPAT